MRKFRLWPALAGVFLAARVAAFSLDDIQLWTGTGTNRAAVVVQWNVPEVFNNTTAPAPVANKTMVWGLRFNGQTTGKHLFNAVVASDPRLYAVENIDPVFGTGLDAIGYHLGDGPFAGVTDGTVTDGPATFIQGILIDPNLNLDGAYPLNPKDLFWSGFYGPYWQIWTEAGAAGGFTNAPRRGSAPYWNPNTYAHGEWASANYGLDGLAITNGSWLGFSISAAGYDGNPNDAAFNAYNNDEQAPPTPDGTYTAVVPNSANFALLVIATNNLATAAPYNDPTAVLGPPSTRFFDPFDGAQDLRVSLINDPFNVGPSGAALLTQIKSGGAITVKLGRPVYDDPANPYGIDFIVYGNSFFGAGNVSGAVGDGTDLNTATLGAGFYGHATTVSVSPDNVNWFTYSNTPALFPENAFRWDGANAAWTEELFNPNKPVNPAVLAGLTGGGPVAAALDQFQGAAGGTGFDLHGSGFPWIQYVRVQPGPGVSTVVDAVAAVSPATVGDALSLVPANLPAGLASLVFQNPEVAGQTQISLHFTSLGAATRIASCALADWSAFAPLPGTVAAGYQLTAGSPPVANPVGLQADLALRVGDAYAGDGGDLHLYQWQANAWVGLASTYNSATRQVGASGLTTLGAFAVTQFAAPRLAAQLASARGFVLRFTPVANATHVLQRSTDLANWTTLQTLPAGPGTQPVTLTDSAPPASRAFYRLALHP